MDEARDDDKLTTQELAQLAAGGDPEAAEALARRVYPTLLSAARTDLRRRFRAVRKWADTHDLAQSAYHDAIRALPSYRPREKATFRGWLLGVLRNKLRRRAAFARAARRDERREVPLADSGTAAVSILGAGSLAAAGSGRGPEALALAAEDRARLERAIETLKDEHRQVIRLRYQEGLPWSEVASLLGKTEEASQMLLHRALSSLRSAFDDARA